MLRFKEIIDRISPLKLGFFLRHRLIECVPNLH